MFGPLQEVLRAKHLDIIKLRRLIGIDGYILVKVVNGVSYSGFCAVFEISTQDIKIDYGPVAWNSRMINNYR